MDGDTVPHRGRGLVISKRILASCVAAVLGLYGIALVAQFLSARKAAGILERADRLKIGDSEAQALEALQACHPQSNETGLSCRIIASPFDLPAHWSPLWTRLENQSMRLDRMMSQIGLRLWSLDVRVKFRESKIRAVSIDAYVIGKYELLGATCVRRAEPLTATNGVELPGTTQRRTSIRRWALPPNGESLVVVLTPESTEKEAQAGDISPKCLSAFYGGRDLCDLMPGVTAVTDAWVGGLPRCFRRNQSREIPRYARNDVYD